MSAPPTLRVFRDADLPAVVALIGSIYAEYGLDLDLEGLDAHLLDPAPYFRGGGGELWVVEDAGGAVVGTVAVKLDASGDEVELKSLYVHPSLRRQGWGRRLVGVVEAFAQEAGRGRVVLWSDTRFEDAHALYAALGYLEMGERAFDDINDTREFGFCRDLPGDHGRL